MHLLNCLERGQVGRDSLVSMIPIPPQLYLLKSPCHRGISEEIQ